MCGPNTTCRRKSIGRSGALRPIIPWSLRPTPRRARRSPSRWASASSAGVASKAARARRGRLGSDEAQKWRESERPPVAPLFRAEHPVARVAEAGNDVAVVVEPLVDRRGPDFHVGMRFCQPFDPLGRGQKADEADALDHAPLEAIHRLKRRSIAATAELAVASIG